MKRIKLLCGLFVVFCSCFLTSLFFSSCGDGGKNASNEVFLESTEGLLYDELEDGRYIVTGIENRDIEELVIDSYNGQPVVLIKEQVFSACEKLKSVVIGDCVMGIGYEAFIDCAKLESVEIGDGVQYIDGAAFKNCNSLTSVSIGTGLTGTGSLVFENCNNLTDVYIDDIVAWCNIEFEVDSNPLCFADNLYLNNSLVTEVTIAEARLIPDNLFCGYDKLTRVQIGGAVESIGSWAFKDCTGLKEVAIEDEGVALSIAERAFENCGLTELVIPDRVHYISWYAFNNCGALKRLIIGDGIQEILTSTFQGCTSLEEIEFGNKLNSIKDGAFEDCSSLVNLVIEKNIAFIGNRAFQHCVSLRSVVIGLNVCAIGLKAFYNCYKLENVTFEDTDNWYVLGYADNYLGQRDLTDSGVNALTLANDKYNYMVREFD